MEAETLRSAIEHAGLAAAGVGFLAGLAARCRLVLDSGISDVRCAVFLLRRVGTLLARRDSSRHRINPVAIGGRPDIGGSQTPPAPESGSVAEAGVRLQSGCVGFYPGIACLRDQRT